MEEIVEGFSVSMQTPAVCGRVTERSVHVIADHSVSSICYTIVQVRQQTELREKWISKIRNHSIVLTEPDSFLEGRYSITIIFGEFFHFEHLLCPRRLLLVRPWAHNFICQFTEHLQHSMQAPQAPTGP